MAKKPKMMMSDKEMSGMHTSGMTKVHMGSDHPMAMKSGWPNRFNYFTRDNIHNARPNANAPLGEGGRFAALQSKLAKQPGVTDPGALAASIGRKKYGAKKFNAMAAHGH